jgi:hypothetical protein
VLNKKPKGSEPPIAFGHHVIQTGRFVPSAIRGESGENATRSQHETFESEGSNSANDRPLVNAMVPIGPSAPPNNELR